MTVARRIALIVVVGLATGVVSQFAQDLLPDGWSQLGNTISPWLVVAFLLGSRMPDPRWAAVAGVTALALAVVAFYTTTTVRFGIGGGTGSLVFWGIGSLAGGVAFGVAGHAWRTSDDRRVRAVAIGLVAAVFVAEGVFQLRVVPGGPVGVAYVAIGAIVPLILGRSARERADGYVATVPALALGALGFSAFLWIGGWTAGLS